MPILVPEDFEINEGNQAIPFTITDQFSRPTPAQYIQVHMTNNPYIIARLTTNSPDYRGELHVTPYNSPEPVDMLTDKAMQMLEPEFPTAKFVSDAIRCIGDCTLLADVIRYQARFTEIERIRDQRAELERKCYLVGLEMGFCWHRLQDVRAIQRIIEEMVQDLCINQQAQVRQHGQCGHGHPA